MPFLVDTYFRGYYKRAQINVDDLPNDYEAGSVCHHCIITMKLVDYTWGKVTPL